MPQGLEFVSMLRKKALSSWGNLLCIRTWLRRAPTILRMCSISTGQSFWQAPQVVQVQISPSVKVAGTSSGRSSRFFPTRALSPASRAFSMLNRIILGERGLSLAKAGQASWQRPHSMQAKASRLSFQVKSAVFSTPKTSDFSRSRAGSSPLGVDAPEEDVERAGEHVEVLGVGDVGDEAVDGDDVGPPGDLEVARRSPRGRARTGRSGRRARGRGTTSGPSRDGGRWRSPRNRGRSPWPG